MTDHPDYQKGIRRGADALAREIDRQLLEQLEWKNRGLPKDCRDACTGNNGYYQIKEPSND